MVKIQVIFMGKLTEIKKRIFAVDILRLLKDKYTYKKLSKLVNLSPTVLSRYINGHILPNSEKSERIIEMFKEKYLLEILRGKISEKEGAYNLTQVHYDVNLQQLIAKLIFHEFDLVKVDKVLTAAADGIPLAVQVGNEFNVKIVIAKKGKEVGVEKFLEEKAIFSPVLFKTFYIPKGSIRTGENVLIVDDIMRTGATIEALVKLVEKSRARVVGIFTIFSTQDSIKKLKRKLRLRCKVKSLINLPLS